MFENECILNSTAFKILFVGISLKKFRPNAPNNVFHDSQRMGMYQELSLSLLYRHVSSLPPLEK